MKRAHKSKSPVSHVAEKLEGLVVSLSHVFRFSNNEVVQFAEIWDGQRLLYLYLKNESTSTNIKWGKAYRFLGLVPFRFKDKSYEEKQLVRCSSQSRIEPIALPVPSHLSWPSEHNQSQLINYMGVVTQDENGKHGLYELDGRFHLVTSYVEMVTSDVQSLQRDDRVTLRNVHHVKRSDSTVWLFMCGRSQLQLLDRTGVETVKRLGISILVDTLHRNNFNANLLIYLFRLHSQLAAKFSKSFLTSLGVKTDVDAVQENLVLEIIFKLIRGQFSGNTAGDTISRRKRSFFDEFLAHSNADCVVTRKMNIPTLPTVYTIDELSSLLLCIMDEESAPNALWTSKMLPFDKDHFKDGFILIGYLRSHLLTGEMVIEDSTGQLSLMMQPSLHDYASASSLHSSIANNKVHALSSHFVALQQFACISEQFRIHRKQEPLKQTMVAAQNGNDSNNVVTDDTLISLIVCKQRHFRKIVSLEKLSYDDSNSRTKSDLHSTLANERVQELRSGANSQDSASVNDVQSKTNGIGNRPERTLHNHNSLTSFVPDSNESANRQIAGLSSIVCDKKSASSSSGCQRVIVEHKSSPMLNPFPSSSAEGNDIWCYVLVTLCGQPTVINSGQSTDDSGDVVRWGEEPLGAQDRCVFLLRGERLHESYNQLTGDEHYQVEVPQCNDWLVFKRRSRCRAPPQIEKHIGNVEYLQLPPTVRITPIQSKKRFRDSLLSRAVYSVSSCLSDLDVGSVATVVARIVNRTHYSAKFDTERQQRSTTTSSEAMFGVPGNKVIRLDLQDTDQSLDATICLYVNYWHRILYPKALVNGAVVCVSWIEKKQSTTKQYNGAVKKKANQYLQTTCFTRFEVISLPDDQQPTPSDSSTSSASSEGAHVGRRMWLYDVVRQDALFTTFWSVVVVRSITKVSIAYTCQVCSAAVSHGRCSYVGCHATEEMVQLNAKANCMVEDGSCERQLLRVSGDQVAILLNTNRQQWDALLLAAKDNELLFLKKPSYITGHLQHSPAVNGRSTAESILHVLCQSSSHYCRHLRVKCRYYGTSTGNNKRRRQQQDGNNGSKNTDNRPNTVSSSSRSAYYDQPMLFCIQVDHVDWKSIVSESKA